MKSDPPTAPTSHVFDSFNKSYFISSSTHFIGTARVLSISNKTIVFPAGFEWNEKDRMITWIPTYPRENNANII